MDADYLDKPIVRMPEIGPGQWINSQRAISRAVLRKKVVLVDFWTYSCVNCLRTMPYVKAWYQRYQAHGLEVLGIHSPEYAFGRIQTLVEKAVYNLGISYPVLMDNDFSTWDQYANRAWPTKYLIDPAGYIRAKHQGEGGYLKTELAIQRLLAAKDPSLSFDDPLPNLREEDQPGASCYRPTPELQAGYQGGGLFGGALGNDEGYVVGSTVAYMMPQAADRKEGHFYLAGFWNAGKESVSFAGRDAGMIIVPYAAAEVNVVLSPTSDSVALSLGLYEDREPCLVTILQDGHPLQPEFAGADIQFDQDGQSYILVDQPRMYTLVQNPGFDKHELEMRIRGNGLAFYSLSFTSCRLIGDTIPGRETYRVQ